MNKGVFNGPGGTVGSGWWSKNQNDGGHSVGPMQLFDKGLQQVFRRLYHDDPYDPHNMKDMADFSLDWAAKHGWGDWHAARNLGIGPWAGIAPNAHPLGLRQTGQTLRSMQELGLGGASAPSGNASLDVTLNGFPAGWRARAEGGSLFKDIQVKRGRSMATAQEDI